MNKQELWESSEKIRNCYLSLDSQTILVSAAIEQICLQMAFLLLCRFTTWQHYNESLSLTKVPAERSNWKTKMASAKNITAGLQKKLGGQISYLGILANFFWVPMVFEKSVLQFTMITPRKLHSNISNDSLDCALKRYERYIIFNLRVLTAGLPQNRLSDSEFVTQTPKTFYARLYTKREHALVRNTSPP